MTFRTARTILLLLAVAFIGGGASSVPAQTSRPEHFGVAVPYPISLPAPTADDSLMAGFIQPYQRLTLYIDEAGCVTNFSSNVMTTSRWQQHFREYLDRIRFQPSTINGVQVAAALPARLYINKSDSTLALHLPVDTAGRVVDCFLYSDALRRHGVRTPAIERFPWYHATFDPADSSRQLRFALAQVEYDTAGRASQIQLTNTDQPNYASQILSAINYAQFLPGQAADSTPIRSGFVLVTFVPTSHYPTKPWTPARADSLDIHDQMALRMLIDTVGVMIPPLPLSRTTPYIGVPLPQSFRGTDLVLPVVIDESGAARVAVDPSKQAEVYPLAMALETQLRFYPSRGYDGRPRTFAGWLIIRSQGASGVRISFPWLEDVALDWAG